MNLKKSAMDLFYRILRKYSKPIEKTIHAEALVRDDMWKKLQNIIGKGYIWFVVTPANYDYCNSYFNLKMNKAQFSEVLKNRIKSLKESNEDIQLHLHLCNVPAFFDKKIQEEKFDEAMNFMSSIGIKPTKFAPGWRQYNDFTISLAKKHGIKMIYDFTGNPLKNPIIKNGVIINYYWKFWHDYDLI